jgi:two-component system chemotaxis response regulator CheY
MTSDTATRARVLVVDGAATAAPVVMISTEDRPGDADLAYRAEANLYLVKPVTGERLVRVATMLTAAGETIAGKEGAE